VSDGEGGSTSAADILVQLQASLGAAYRIEREIGGGGMSRVFLADEPGLGRKVVIKMLAPELAAGISVERFEREIKLAASLQQANIVPLLSAGVAAGFPCYTMPHVEGRSLRERLMRDGPLPIGDAVSVLRDVARALAYAHERGVVHRDIKPANVLLSGGTAVVTHFGIAKAIGAARGTVGVEALTQTGMGIGTPAYMAPEQAAGDPTADHRADMYAFGCLAYELFTGKPPFHGEASHRIIAAHFSQRPRPLTDGRPDIPPAIALLIERCLEKDPSRRPRRAAELLQGLDAATSQPIVPPMPRAYAALATALELYPYFFGSRPDEVKQRATTAATRALELDSTLADAHTALGGVYAAAGEWSRAEPEFRHAIALEPDNVEARFTYGRTLILR